MLKKITSLRGFLQSDYFVLASGAIFIKIITTIQTGFLARILEVNSYGVLVAILSGAGFVSRMFDLGLPSAFSYFARTGQRISKVLLELIYAHLVILSAIFLLILIGYQLSPMSEYIGFQLNQNIKIYNFAIYILVLIGLALFNSLLISSGSYKDYNKITILFSITNIVLLYTLYIYNTFSIDNIIQCLIINGFLNAIVIYINIKKKIDFKYNKLNKNKIEIFKYGIKIHYGVVAKLFGTSIELPLVAILFDSKITAMYSVGVFFREMIMFLFGSYSRILQNKIFSSCDIKEIYNSILKKQVFILISLVLIIQLFIPDLITLIFGKNFIKSELLVRCLIICGFFNSISSLCWMRMQAIGKVDYVLKMLLVSAILTPISIYLISKINEIDSITYLAISAISCSFLVLMQSLNYTVLKKTQALIRNK